MKPHYTPGNKFGRLTIMARGPKYTVWCKCDCGNISTPAANDLLNGLTSSCGCLQRERASASNKAKKTTHGLAGTAAYKSWAAMKERCLNPNHQASHNYTGRGITIDERWNKFENFYQDMGDRPVGTTLDRENNDLGYTKSNCRWATYEEQCNNTRFNVRLTHAGENLTLAQWSRKLNIGASTLNWRVTHGWSIERILTTPSSKRKEMT